MELFGFKLDSIKIEDLDGKITEINYSENGCSSKTNFQQLPENDKTTIRALLYIMDKCCVGDSAYHEMSMLVDGLPRSYLIKQCRNAQNSISHITRTPGKHPGAQMSFKGELREQIRKKIQLGDVGKQKVIIAGNHTVGIVSGSEDYEVLRISCKEILAEINDLVEHGEIEVDGHRIPLEFYLSGDYKIQWDTSKAEDYYHNSKNARTLSTNRSMACKSSSNYGCIKKPLLGIPIENVRVDELHLLLRITDIF
ncbi:Hypothetical predicted protein [Paramuricea clavata]|uniref:Uncharacterized protein n=1 Tax=Paramuricea clavata TaxID=317549 RepID=A0A7D9DYK5_PARCT|nr:Hypothetical predicted protein [Paramuricea clavata]